MTIQDLASVRRSKCISLEQVSKQTKIRVGLLQAIEEGRLQALPGGVYTINFIQQYAMALGLDSAEVHPSSLSELEHPQVCENRECIGPEVAPSNEEVDLPDHIL